MRATLDKEKVQKMYLEGYNAKEISNIVQANVDTIRTCIKRNFKHLKEKHEIAVITRKEVIKAVNYEAKKCMSDKAFINKNKSIYRTKKNGDIVINEEAAPVTTWDTPIRFNNEKDLTKKKVKIKILN